jgi:hypothetical protein
MFEEYELLKNKLEQILPFEAYPVRELVVQMRDKISLTLKSKLIVESVYNSNDITGILCTVKTDNNNVFACALTHLVIPVNNPLFKEIKQYQDKRIKRVKKLNSRH